MTKTGTLFCLPLLFLLFPTAFSSTATEHQLSFFTDNTQKIKVEDGSKLYLASRDKAVALSRITLTSNGKSTTLQQLIGNFDENGFMNGWPVNSDLSITTTNSVNVTKELKGEIFICTPQMAADPDFLVYVVRGSKLIDRKLKNLSTIVFLSIYNPDTDGNSHSGFKHIRVENIAQPTTTFIYFLRDLIDDYYTDFTNSNTTGKIVFSNPLRHTLAGGSHVTFFNTIDPLQFSNSIWFHALGGFQMSVSDSSVDTTNIAAGAVTVTGMANSQLLTNTSQVTFKAQGENRYGASGYVLSTDLFQQSNLTVQMNGAAPRTDSYTVSGLHNIRDDFHEFKWQAVNLQLQPSNLFSGWYYVQYFNIDNGPVTAAPLSTASTAAPTGSTAPPAVSTSTVVPPTSSQTTGAPQTSSTSIQTTTSSSSTTMMIISMFVTFLVHVLH